MNKTDKAEIDAARKRTRDFNAAAQLQIDEQRNQRGTAVTGACKSHAPECAVMNRGSFNCDCKTGEGNAPRVGLVEYDGKWLVGFDGGGRPIWSFNRLRAGVFNHAEISAEFSRHDKRKLSFIEV